MERFTCPLASHWVWPLGSSSKSQEEGRKERLGYLIHQFLPHGVAWNELCPSTQGLSVFQRSPFSIALSFWGARPFSPRG